MPDANVLRERSVGQAHDLGCLSTPNDVPELGIWFGALVLNTLRAKLACI